MSVTVDHEVLPAEKLGLRTVGQVLAHLQRDNRLPVHVLIDGQEPDLARLNVTKQVPICGHTLYIETANPKELARDALSAVEDQLAEVDRLKNEAAELLQKNQTVKAMEKLSGCFTTWQHAHESMIQTGQLLRIDLASILIDGQPLSDMLESFAVKLREIKVSLEHRDFVALSDILLYETSETSVQWGKALESMRQAIGSIH